MMSANLMQQSSISWQLLNRVATYCVTAGILFTLTCCSESSEPEWAKYIVPAKSRSAADLPENPKHGQSWTNSYGMKFVFISPGKFMMGSPPDEEGRDDDETLHEVRITKGYWISTTEVTRSQFAAFVIDTGYLTVADIHADPSNGWAKWHYSSRRGGKQPVDWLTWIDAKAFSDWLAKKEGRTYSLPTEAQWEYACRAGTTTRFHTGDEVPTIEEANVQQFAAEPSEGGPETLINVGSYAPNQWGLYDMHGNSAEWCLDWYAQFTDELAVDPRGPITGKYRILRGGNYSYDAGFMDRSAARFPRTEDRDPMGGIRVVVEP